MNARLTLQLKLWRHLFLFLLLTTQCYSRPLHMTEKRVQRDTSGLRLHNTKEGGKIRKEGPPIPDKKDDDEEGMYVFQGDIILSYDELMEIQEIGPQAAAYLPRAKRNAGSGMEPVDKKMSPPKIHNKLWPNCRVPYIIDDFIHPELRESFMNAIVRWEHETCIRFELKTPDDENYLYLTRGAICKSQVGMQSGKQDVFLSHNCNTTGHALHELGHALGLWHEHSRPDRDQFIKFHRENIFDKNDEINFRIINTAQFQEMPFVKYDIQSIMHYSAYTFARSYEPGQETITIREDADLPELNCTNTLHMGQREKLSYLDKKRLSLLYDCEFNLEEPECLLPTPSATTPPATTEPATTTMPTPTTTITAATAPPLSKKLNTGNVIVLKFGNEYGIECVPTPGCTPTQDPCKNFGGDTCETPLNQFQIVNHPSINSPKIRNGNTVLLRSVNSPSNWLDCSDITRCVISPCGEDIVEDPGNASYTSNCSKHHFQVYGVGRSSRQRLTVNTPLQLKYSDPRDPSIGGYMTCNNNICQLLKDGICPRRPLPFAPVNDHCAPEEFSVTKLRE